MIKHFHRFTCCFILGLIIAGCNTSNKKSDTFDYISIASSPCNGECPVFQLELRNDGFFTFHGSSNCQKTGSFQRKLTNEEMSKIETYFSQLTLKKTRQFFPLRLTPTNRWFSSKYTEKPIIPMVVRAIFLTSYKKSGRNYLTLLKHRNS